MKTLENDMQLSPTYIFILNSLLETIPQKITEQREKAQIKSLIRDLLSQDDARQIAAFQKLNALESLSALNNTPSQFKQHITLLLGICYYDGIGVEENNKTAFKLFKSIHTVQPFALALLAELYLSGDGGELNTKKAQQLNRIGSQANNPLSQYTLASMYEEGIECEQNSHKAFAHFIESARQGFPPAQYEVAVMLVSGRGVEIDNKLAAEFFERVLPFDIQDSAHRLGILYFQGLGVEKDIKRGLELFALAGKKDPAVYYHLGQIFCKGLGGVKQDLVQARLWYRTAGENGHVFSQFKYANMCFQGTGGDKSIRLGAEWFKKAALNGILEADNNLSVFQGDTLVGEEHSAEMSDWLQEHAKNGFAWAQANLARRYANGKILSPRLNEQEYLEYINEFSCTAENCKACHKEISIASRGITCTWIEGFSACLQTNRKLEGLILDDNPIGDTGAIQLANLLYHNSVLKRLSLGSCGITDKGFKAFGDVLSVTSNLVALSLWGNDITCAGILRFFEKLKANPNTQLKSLWLAANQLDFQVLVELAVLLKQNTSLCSVTLGSKEGMNITLGGKQPVPPATGIKQIVKDAKEVSENDLNALLTTITKKLYANQKEAYQKLAQKTSFSAHVQQKKEAQPKKESKEKQNLEPIAPQNASPTPRPRPKLTIDTKLPKDLPASFAPAQTAGTPIIFSKEFNNLEPLLAPIPIKRTKSTEKENVSPAALISSAATNGVA